MCKTHVNRKGISPVIATVIIVAVTITVAVAISFWMGGIAGLYTRFEKLEIVYATVSYDNTGKYWTVTLKVKNTGSADTKIDDILLNGVTIQDVKNSTHYANWTYNSSSVPSPSVTPGSDQCESVSISLNSGSEVYIVVAIPEGAKMGSSTAISGLSLELKLHTSGGKEYPKILTLP
ncbi:MAG: type IV pilin [archaeon GBS-70-058]|nr:type IV pilin [Candidatus Culexarchaeum nevadense]